MALELHSLDITDITCYNVRAIFRQLQNKPVVRFVQICHFFRIFRNIPVTIINQILFLDHVATFNIFLIKMARNPGDMY